MPKHVLFVRCSIELVALLDRLVAAYRKDHPGARFTRSDVVRELLLQAAPAALADAEARREQI